MGKYMVDNRNWINIKKILNAGCQDEKRPTTHVINPAVRYHDGGFEVFFNDDRRTHQESNALDSILSKWMINTHQGNTYSQGTSTQNKVKNFKNELKHWFEESVKHDKDYEKYAEEGILQPKIVSFIVVHNDESDTRNEEQKQIRVPVTGKMFIVPLYIESGSMPFPVEYGNVRCTDSSKEKLPKLHMTADIKLATWLVNNWLNGEERISDIFKKSILKSFKTDLGTDLEKFYPLLAGTKMKKATNNANTTQVGTMIGVRGGVVFKLPKMSGSYVYALGVLEPKDCVTKFNPHNWYSPAKLTAKIIINQWNSQTNKDLKKLLLNKLHETAKYESENALDYWFLGEANLLCKLYRQLCVAEYTDEKMMKKKT